MKSKSGVPAAPDIEPLIRTLREQRVILDADLALIYGVPTKRLNEQVKRNINRFPPDFMFQLTAAEKSEVVANCDHLAGLKFSHALPFAFSEHGSIMAANVLNSPRAVQMSVFVVRAFVGLRRLLANHDALRLLHKSEVERLMGCTIDCDHYATAIEILGQGVQARVLSYILHQLGDFLK